MKRHVMQKKSKSVIRFRFCLLLTYPFLHTPAFCAAEVFIPKQPQLQYLPFYRILRKKTIQFGFTVDTARIGKTVFKTRPV